MRFLVMAAALLIAGAAAAQEQPNAQAPGATERVYSAAKSKLLQIRSIVLAANRQSSIGSAFLANADGIAITNYHVVSQFVLEPETYRLEYIAADGGHGAVTVIAVDIADDLAAVRIARTGDKPADYLRFDARALRGELPKGDRLHSLGNPLDLGFTVVDGTYSGDVERSYGERFHFSGAINPGMSGGPTVTDDGLVVGVNVSKQTNGELVSFLVPARFAAALLERAEKSPAADHADLRAEVGRQLSAWQAEFYRTFEEAKFREADFGPYLAPESAAGWFTCWGSTNAGQLPAPRASVNTTNCFSNSQLFIAGDLTTGRIHLVNSHVRGVDLNAFQFATFLSAMTRAPQFGVQKKWFTAARCREDFVESGGANPPVYFSWCARAYRPFADLYDVAVIAVTQDRAEEALVSRLNLQAVSYDNATAIGEAFLKALQWKK